MIVMLDETRKDMITIEHLYVRICVNYYTIKHKFIHDKKFANLTI